MRALFLLLVLLTCGAGAEPLALTNATVHTAVEEAFVGFVVIDGDRIVSVGRGQPPAGLSRQDLGGQHLYPALIDPDSSLGLVDIESVKGSVDVQETGEINPNLQTHLAFRAESDLVAVARSQGILVAGVQPLGGLISGQGSVMRMWGWNWQEMTLKPGWCMALNWPTMVTSTRDDDEKRKEFLDSLGQKLYALREAFAAARVYQPGQPRDVKWEALAPAARGQQKLLVRAQNRSEITAALDWAEREKVALVLVCGAHIEDFAETLAQRGVAVIYASLNNTVPDRDQSYDNHYRVPAQLRRAGVVTALTAGGLAFDARELRDLAGRTLTFGQSQLQALQSITLNPARILGVADRLGSIEAGKEATLVLCDGDLLEVAARVTRAWGRGVELDLEDRQKRLYRHYRARPK